MAFKRFIDCSSTPEIINYAEQYSNKRYANSGLAVPQDDFLYVKVRAVSAGDLHGPNNNGDYFSRDELRSKYATFKNRGVFVNHQSNDIEKCRGKICLANLIDTDKECYVTLVLGVDEKAFPQLGRAIRRGYTTDVSMGATVKYSFCSICRNRAHNEKQYCTHLANYKGSTFQGQKVFEDNKDVNFFEISFVVDGADPDAKLMEILGTVKDLQDYRRVAAETSPGLRKVASQSYATVEDSTAQIVGYIKQLQAKNYNADMIKYALKQSFEDLSDRQIDALGELTRTPKQTFTYSAGIHGTILGQLLRGN